MTFPPAPAPMWFREKISVHPGERLVILDDNASIHGVWQRRFAAFERWNVTLHNFSKAKDLETWIATQRDFNHVLYLIDYELLRNSANGLDVMERLNLRKQSILVTSRFDDPGIRARAESMGVSMIPKSMAGLVPIDLEHSASRLNKSVEVELALHVL